MTLLNLRTLIQKLNPECQRSLEAAVGFCLSRSHYHVEIEHWLLTLSESQLFSQQEIDIARLKSDIQSSLEQFKTGSSKSPVLSQSIVDWIREAWILASLEASEQYINENHLLLTLLQEPQLQRIAVGISSEFKKILPQNLKTGINETPLTHGTLEKFTIDLTEQARLGKIDPVIGRDEETSQLIDILMRRRQNNPILTGEPGVGKTAVVEGLALRIISGDVPNALKKTALLVLDMGLLQAGAGIKGEFENRLKSVIQEIKKSSKPIILFIDEAHTLVGSGEKANHDAANLLKPALARGELRTIAATTWAEYKKYFEKDAALARRFQVIKIEEPSEDAAVQILRGIAGHLEQHHNVQILDEAIIAAVQLSHHYLSERQLPDKAISVLDTACAHRAIRATHPPANIDIQCIADVISNWTGIPVSRITGDKIAALLSLADRLQERIAGQTHALRAISERIYTSKAQLTDPCKPISIFLFLGPSGVGKTETALALAEQLYGSEKHVTVINLSEFKEEHKVSLLLGSPPGYVGYGEGGMLTESVRRRPYSLVLLDEIEKAHRGIHDIFYQIFDKGSVRDGEGRDIDFKNTVIILTSNIGSETLIKLAADCENFPSQQELLVLLRPELLKIFKPAFLGRLTIIPYLPLNNAIMKKIIVMQLDRIKSRIAKHHQAEFLYTEAVVDYINQQCQETESGARAIEHLLNKTLLPELSLKFLSAIAEGKSVRRVEIDVDRGAIPTTDVVSAADIIPAQAGDQDKSAAFIFKITSIMNKH